MSSLAQTHCLKRVAADSSIVETFRSQSSMVEGLWGARWDLAVWLFGRLLSTLGCKPPKYSPQRHSLECVARGLDPGVFDHSLMVFVSSLSCSKIEVTQPPNTPLYVMCGISTRMKLLRPLNCDCAHQCGRRRGCAPRSISAPEVSYIE